MKKYYLFYFSLILTFLISCNNEELNSIENQQQNLIVPEVSVVNGILCFKNEASIEVVKNEIQGRDYEGLASWEDNLGFKSIERSSSEITDAILCRVEQYIAKGLTEQELLQKFDSGEIEEVPFDIQQQIENLKLEYRKLDDGMRKLDYSFMSPVPNRFLNENYEIVIADTLYRYSADKVEVFPGFENLKSISGKAPIIGYRSVIKDDPFLKDVTLRNKVSQLCFDEAKDSDHKLEAQFKVERIIYQKSSCASGCVKTQAFAKIYYQGYYKQYFMWHAGVYNVDGAVGFDVQYYDNQSSTTTVVGRQTPSYNTQTSPIVLYSSPVLENAYITWFAIGNVDCMNVNMGQGVECVCNQQLGTLGLDRKHGYSPLCYLMNDI